MKASSARAGFAAALALALIGVSGRVGAAATKPTAPPSPSAAASKSAGSAPLLPGSSSKEPISIEADKLVYFDKEQKAIYTGNVVVVQGDGKMTCAVMTIYMDKAPEPRQPGAAKTAEPAKTGDAASAAPSAGSSRVKHLDCAGPVTVLSKTQVVTGDKAAYDKPQNKVWVIGNVTMSDGGNVTKGDTLTYDLTTAQATVDQGPAATRVKGLFIPGSGGPASDDASKVPNGNDKTKAAK